MFGGEGFDPLGSATGQNKLFNYRLFKNKIKLSFKKKIVFIDFIGIIKFLSLKAF